ncbi:TIGR01244 family sulfur transferase [Consotaella aegiceratis]|uniref:TIGR01244 family sulfur transferase n=1 Tax=Consotaella aegiceratis TaxID=3097961 RepID=UPI002F423511
MNVKRITDEFAVCGQIMPSDFAALRQAGFRSIIANRPDGEERGQPSFAETQAAVEAAGLEIRHVPVRSPGPADAASFGRAFEELPKPVLAFCRSGARSSMLWTLWQAGREA